MCHLETLRLKLENIQLIDAKEVYENFTAEVIQYMYPAVNQDIEETKRFIQSMINARDNGTDYVFTVRNKENREFIGVAGLHGLQKEVPELGIWTKVHSHGNHYGRESIGPLIQLAKEKGFKKLIYPVDRKNIASRKIPEFYGGKIIKEGVLVKTPDGRTLDEVIYEIVI